MTYKVLIVDDSSVARRVLEVYVRKGFNDRGEAVEIRTAISSADAEEIVMRRLLDPIDLFLVDYDMPGRTGIDFKIHSALNPAMSHVVDSIFMIVSGSSFPELINASEDAGFADWLLKPVRTRDIARVVDLVIGTTKERK